MARENGLDLVCFNRPEIGTLAFCKILDFGKWKYENEKKKKKEQKSSHKESKEIRFSALICENDIAHKVRQVNEFLNEGATVTLTMKLRGREKSHFDLASEKMNQISSLCSEHGKIVGKKSDGGIIIIRMTSLGEVKTTN
jgi:translation initiation factor IF-3